MINNYFYFYTGLNLNPMEFNLLLFNFGIMLIMSLFVIIYFIIIKIH